MSLLVASMVRAPTRAVVSDHSSFATTNVNESVSPMPSGSSVSYADVGPPQDSHQVVDARSLSALETVSLARSVIIKASPFNEFSSYETVAEVAVPLSLARDRVIRDVVAPLEADNPPYRFGGLVEAASGHNRVGSFEDEIDDHEHVVGRARSFSAPPVELHEDFAALDSFSDPCVDTVDSRPARGVTWAPSPLLHHDIMSINDLGDDADANGAGDAGARLGLGLGLGRVVPPTLPPLAQPPAQGSGARSINPLSLQPMPTIVRRGQRLIVTGAVGRRDATLPPPSQPGSRAAVGKRHPAPMTAQPTTQRRPRSSSSDGAQLTTSWKRCALHS